MIGVRRNGRYVTGKCWRYSVGPPHQLSCLEVVIRPVERIVHPDLLSSNSYRGIKLTPEIREDAEAFPNARAENDDLLLSHVINHPPKVRKVSVLDAMAEGTEEELDLWSAIRPLHRVVMVSKADKVADPFGLISG